MKLTIATAEGVLHLEFEPAAPPNQTAPSGSAARTWRGPKMPRNTGRGSRSGADDGMFHEAKSRGGDFGRRPRPTLSILVIALALASTVVGIIMQIAFVREWSSFAGWIIAFALLVTVTAIAGIRYARGDS